MIINIAIVDDIAVNRNTTKSKLEDNVSINVLFEASNGEEFLKKLKKANTLPDVVLIDLEMPIMNGIETIYKSKTIAPSIKFIVLTIYENSDIIFDAIKAGAHGYLLKEDTAVNIVEAINSVFEFSSIPMSPSIARKALQIMLGVKENNETNEEHILSKREQEILKCLVAGKNYKKIGDELFISSLTVRKHVANIYEKLHVNSRAQIINLAHEKKWI